MLLFIAFITLFILVYDKECFQGDFLLGFVGSVLIITFLLSNVIVDTFGKKLSFVTLLSRLFKFSTLSVTLISEHNADKFYNCNSKQMFL